MNGKKPPEPQNPNLSNPSPAPKEGGAPSTMGRDARHPDDRDGNVEHVPQKGASRGPKREGPRGGTRSKAW